MTKRVSELYNEARYRLKALEAILSLLTLEVLDDDAHGDNKNKRIVEALDLVEKRVSLMEEFLGSCRAGLDLLVPIKTGEKRKCMSKAVNNLITEWAADAGVKLPSDAQWKLGLLIDKHVQARVAMKVDL